MAARWKILVAGALGLAICVGIVLTGPQPLEASIPAGNPQVAIGALQRIVMPRAITAYGTLAPRQSLQLTSQVPGEITWVHQDLVPGGTVPQGEVLFRIDERDYEIAVASAEARYAQAQAQIEIERGRSEIAELEWTAWQDRQTQREEPNALALREPQKAEAQAQRRAILAELKQARLALERTQVRAKWPASVVSANAIRGQVLSVGEVVATLFPIENAVVELQVPANALRVLEAGIEHIELTPVDDPNAAPVVGRFERVVRSLADETRLATLRVIVEQPLEHVGWAFGMHLQARVVARQQQSVAMIPPDLIVSGNLLWVHRNGQAVRHQIFPVAQRGDMIAVQDNFQVADAIILERPIGLFDGANVDAVPQ